MNNMTRDEAREFLANMAVTAGDNLMANLLRGPSESFISTITAVEAIQAAYHAGRMYQPQEVYLEELAGDFEAMASWPSCRAGDRDSLERGARVLRILSELKPRVK